MKQILAELNELEKLKININNYEKTKRLYFKNKANIIIEQCGKVINISNVIDFAIIRDKILLYVKEEREYPQLFKAYIKKSKVVTEKIFDFTDLNTATIRNIDLVRNLLVIPGTILCNETFYRKKAPKNANKKGLIIYSRNKKK